MLLTALPLLAALLLAPLAAFAAERAAEPPTAPTVLDYLGVDLSKGGVQSDLADLAPFPNMKIGGAPASPDKLPKGLSHFADLGVVMPEWVDVRVIHRLPQPREEDIPKIKGGKNKSVAYVDCPRPLITPRGDYLLTMVSGMQ